MYILFDIGASYTKLALSKNLKTIEKFKVFPSPPNFSQALIKIKEAIFELLGKKKALAICLAVAGLVDEDKGIIINCPNLKDWSQKSLKKLIQKDFNCPVYLANDADLAGLGEAVYGVGRAYSIVAYLSLGTGVGGSRIVNRQIDQSKHGFEPGHQIIDRQKRKSLEDLIGGKNFKKNYQLRAPDCSDGKIWRAWQEDLALGLVNTIVMWSPEVIILGGGLMQNHLSSQNLPALVAKNLKIVKVPPIRRSILKDKAALYGALYYLKNKLSK